MALFAEGSQLTQGQYAQRLSEMVEAERCFRIDAARAKAQQLGRELRELHAKKAANEYCDFNPRFIFDPEIDILEMRYREAVRVLETLDRSNING